jgi:transcriptional repressor NrdR
MRCPKCKQNRDQVLDSRETQSGEAVRRRRECLACGARFTTYERFDVEDLQVIKRDGRREPFNRDKMLGGLARACEKTPVQREQLERIVSLVEEKIAAAPERALDSEAIGELIMEQLKPLNSVAYVRFASVYRRFAEMEDFIALARGLKTAKPATARRRK